MENEANKLMLKEGKETNGKKKEKTRKKDCKIRKTEK